MTRPGLGYFTLYHLGEANRTIPNKVLFQVTMIFRQYGNTALTKLDDLDTVGFVSSGRTLSFKQIPF